MKLKNFKIDNGFGCLKYCLTRIGMEHLYPITYDQLMDCDEFEVLMFNIDEEFQKGDIFVGSASKQTKFIANEIIGNEIISNPVDMYIHYVCYDGRGLCTDLIRRSNSGTPYLRKFYVIDQSYDYILRRR